MLYKTFLKPGIKVNKTRSNPWLPFLFRSLYFILTFIFAFRIFFRFFPNPTFFVFFRCSDSDPGFVRILRRRRKRKKYRTFAKTKIFGEKKINPSLGPFRSSNRVRRFDYFLLSLLTSSKLHLSAPKSLRGCVIRTISKHRTMVSILASGPRGPCVRFPEFPQNFFSRIICQCCRG